MHPLGLQTGLDAFGRYIVHRPAIPIAPVCSFVVGVYDALNFAHDKHVMHKVVGARKIVMKPIKEEAEVLSAA